MASRGKPRGGAPGPQPHNATAPAAYPTYGLRAGTVLVARGEFSIVIAGLAVAAGLQARLGPLATAYVLVLAVLGPLVTRAADPLAAVLRRPPRPSGERAASPPATAARISADAAPSNDGDKPVTTP